MFKKIHIIILQYLWQVSHKSYIKIMNQPQFLMVHQAPWYGMVCLQSQWTWKNLKVCNRKEPQSFAPICLWKLASFNMTRSINQCHQNLVFFTISVFVVDTFNNTILWVKWMFLAPVANCNEKKCFRRIQDWWNTLKHCTTINYNWKTFMSQIYWKLKQ